MSNNIKNQIIIKNQNINLIRFEEIFRSIQLNVINDITKYNLNIKQLNKDTKNIIKTNTIEILCNYYINNLNKKYKNIIYIQPSIITQNNEIFNYINYQQFNIFYTTLLLKISNLIPVPLYFADVYIDFECFPDCEGVISGKGEYTELIIRLNAFYKAFIQKNYTFEKVKIYTAKNNLKFLSEEYFNSLKTKTILIKV